MSSGSVLLTTGEPWFTHSAIPEGWTGLSSHRRGRWEWDLLDLNEDQLGTLDGVTDGSIDLNINADTRGSGSLTWNGQWDDLPDWDRLRVRPRYVAVLDDGTEVDWSMGVYLLTTPAMTNAVCGVTGSVDFYDKTLILRQDATGSTFGLSAGTAVVPAVREIIGLSVQAGRVAIEDSDEVLRTAMVWPAGTTRLRIVNDLLDSIDYFAVWADGEGTLRSSAYQGPAQRPLAWEFEDGLTCIYKAGFTHTRDTFEVPNKVLVISEGDGDTPALRSVRSIDEIDPSHPLSHASRGRWITRVEENVEATSQAVLNSYADRLIRESLQTAATIDIEHAPLEPVMNGRYRFAYSGGVDATDCVLQKVAIECSPTALWRSTLREVAL